MVGGIHICVAAGSELAKVIAAPDPDNASFRQSAKVARACGHHHQRLARKGVCRRGCAVKPQPCGMHATILRVALHGGTRAPCQRNSLLFQSGREEGIGFFVFLVGKIAKNCRKRGISTAQM